MTETLDTRLGQAAAAGVLLVAGIAILVAVFSGGGSDDENAPLPRDRQAAGRFADPRLGYRLRYPVDWKRSRPQGALQLTSPDGTVAMAISSPAALRIPVTVARDALGQLRTAFRPARVLARTSGRLGPLPARTYELSGRAGKRAVRILLVVAASRHRTYAAQLTTAVRPSGRRLREARAILASLRFARPSR